MSFAVVTTGTITGTITRATGGSPLSGATVQAVLIGLIKGTATSAADGTYSIPNLDPGTYDVRVLATGYSSEVRSGTSVSANVTTTVNVAVLQPGSADVTAAVVAAARAKASQVERFLRFGGITAMMWPESDLEQLTTGRAGVLSHGFRRAALVEHQVVERPRRRLVTIHTA